MSTLITMDSESKDTDLISRLFRLDGRKAVVAGGAGLIGSTLTEALAASGADVGIVDIDDDLASRQAESIAKNQGQLILPFGTDISESKSVKKLLPTVVDQLGGCDILINCAHYKEGAFFSNIEDYPVETWERVLKVNLTGTFLMCREFGGWMNANRGGVIVNISSTYGVVSADHRVYGNSGIDSPVSYAASKSGILNFSRYLATHWAPRIRVNVLVPGGVEAGQDSDFIERYSWRTPLGRMARRQEYQGAVLFMVSDASSYMTGSVLTVDGGWTAW